MDVFLDGWYIAATSNQVKKAPIRRVVEGKTLVLFRDEIGQVQALVDHCLHRGMRLSNGCVKQGTLECPYHGWRYNGKGEVVSQPALCDHDPLKSKTLSIDSFPTLEQEEHIWVYIGHSPPKSPPFSFPFYGEKGWGHFFMHTQFEASVVACLENFLDVPHTVYVHPGLFRKGSLTAVKARITKDSHSVKAEFLNEPVLTGIGPRLFFPKGTQMRHTDAFYLPSISRVDYTFSNNRAFLITSQCTRQDDGIVNVTTHIAWNLPLPKMLCKPILRAYCRHVILQDVRLLKKIGQQTERFGPQFLHTNADLLGRHIISLRKNAADGTLDDNEAISVYERELNL